MILALLIPLLPACVWDPMRFIPANERQVLQAEALLAGSGAAPQPPARISVEDLLAQARQGEPPSAVASPTPSAPETPRQAVQASTPAQPGPISVEAMLARARDASPATSGATLPASAEPRAGTAPVVATAALGSPGLALRFTGDEVQPSDAQRAQVENFARRNRGAQVTISARSGGDLLGPRRALAVARLLQPRFPDVELRFDPAVPPDEVSLIASRPPPEPSR